VALVQLDGIVSALHVFDSSSETVTISRVGACGTGVGFVETKSMCPAVVHRYAVIGGDRCWGGSLGDGGGCCDFAVGSWNWFVALNSGSIGPVESSLAGCEFAEAFLVFSHEENAELGEGFVGGWADAPHVTSHGENASGF